VEIGGVAHNMDVLSAVWPSPRPSGGRRRLRILCTAATGDALFRGESGAAQAAFLLLKPALARLLSLARASFQSLEARVKPAFSATSLLFIPRFSFLPASLVQPNYCGEFDNAGAMMSVDATLMCSFHILKSSEAQRGR